MKQLQYITHYTQRYSYAEGARLALEGGCHWIQLRMKDASEAELREVAEQIRPWCRECGATFILDDHVELVKDLQADGVHLGKNDMPISEARRVLGPSYIIGGTANTLEDAIHQCKEGADYLGCGPFRYTTTKKNLAPVLGIEGYRKIIEGLRAQGYQQPVVAIGGIKAEDIPAIMETGVSGIALSSSVLQAEDPVSEMRRVIGRL